MGDYFSEGPFRSKLQGQIADKRSSGRGGGRPAAALYDLAGEVEVCGKAHRGTHDRYLALIACSRERRAECKRPQT